MMPLHIEFNPSAPDANGWMPIETAPRETQRMNDIEAEFIVIVFDADVEKTFRVQTAFWNEIIGRWQPCDDNSPRIRPTDWQPLPAPPVQP